MQELQGIVDTKYQCTDFLYYGGWTMYLPIETIIILTIV